jgi:hypothetical protein
MIRLSTGLLLVALPVALAAQQAKPTQTPTPAKPTQTQTPAKPSTAGGAFPTGTYSVTMSDGSIILVTFADGAYHATQDGQPIATGKYTAKGDQIVVSDNSDACGMSGEGTYTWAFDGKALTFKGSKDGCDTRLQIMTGYPFVKK